MFGRVEFVFRSGGLFLQLYFHCRMTLSVENSFKTQCGEEMPCFDISEEKENVQIRVYHVVISH